MNKQLIHSDPEIMGGTPCITGTRLTVYAVAARIRGGETIGHLLDGYPPEIGEDHVWAALEYAERVPFVDNPAGKPWRRTSKVESAA
jgi:uncharacterized protein (DUF433 family)